MAESFSRLDLLKGVAVARAMRLVALRSESIHDLNHHGGG